MTTILFVHGTGVRADSYDVTLEQVRRGLAKALPDAAVEGCAWGDVLGVGAQPTARAEEDEAEPVGTGAVPGGPRWSDAERAVWARLYDDPLFEIRLTALEDTPPPSARALSLLRDRISALPDQPEIRDALTGEGPGPDLPGPDRADAAGAGPEGPADARQSGARQAAAPQPTTPEPAALREAARLLLADAEFQAALPSLAAAKSHDLIARALVSAYIRLREEAAGGVIVAADDRDALARALTDALGGVALGVGSRARGAAWTTAQYAARPYLRRRRDKLLDLATPAAGDILVYQARGKALRRFIAERVRAVEGPVVLLGHSLGGIASFETLLTESLPQVELVVTVGSQVPYLHGLDALATHRLGAPLPERFRARWLNLHDPVDLLSYPAAPYFGSRVVDVQVDTREPFPRAHSAYWTTRAVYEAVRVQVEGGPR
ncbi:MULTISPECIES: hypothetical protein [unclassified Streptomyces]|uniref:hypothetical protein n=1 Tax=unclassified Streptomyces TaxID=2593676 RepID=UPI002E2A78E0|nr:hypothetical protein [Streptomyces sp. NBC_00223]